MHSTSQAPLRTRRMLRTSPIATTSSPAGSGSSMPMLSVTIVPRVTCSTKSVMEPRIVKEKPPNVVRQPRGSSDDDVRRTLPSSIRTSSASPSSWLATLQGSPGPWVTTTSTRQDSRVALLSSAERKAAPQAISAPTWLGG